MSRTVWDQEAYDLLQRTHRCVVGAMQAMGLPLGEVVRTTFGPPSVGRGWAGKELQITVHPNVVDTCHAVGLDALGGEWLVLGSTFLPWALPAGVDDARTVQACWCPWTLKPGESCHAGKDRMPLTEMVAIQVAGAWFSYPGRKTPEEVFRAWQHKVLDAVIPGGAKGHP